MTPWTSLEPRRSLRGQGGLHTNADAFAATTEYSKGSGRTCLERPRVSVARLTECGCSDVVRPHSIVSTFVLSLSLVLTYCMPSKESACSLTRMFITPLHLWREPPSGSAAAIRVGPVQHPELARRKRRRYNRLRFALLAAARPSLTLNGQMSFQRSTPLSSSDTAKRFRPERAT